MVHEENKMYQLNELNQSTIYTLLNLVSQYLNYQKYTHAIQAINRKHHHRDIYQQNDERGK